MTTQPTPTATAKPKPRRAPYPPAWRWHWFDAGRPSSTAVSDALGMLLETVVRKQQQEAGDIEQQEAA